MSTARINSLPMSKRTSKPANEWALEEVEEEQKWPQGSEREHEELEELRRSLAEATQRKQFRSVQVFIADRNSPQRSASQMKHSAANSALATAEKEKKKTKKKVSSTHDSSSASPGRPKTEKPVKARESSLHSSAAQATKPPPLKRISNVGNWVKEFLLANSLEWAVRYFDKINFSLELVPYIDGEQLDDLLTLAKCEIRKSNKSSKSAAPDVAPAPTAAPGTPTKQEKEKEAMSSTEIDPVEKIKLVCALRSMKTQLQAQAAPALQPAPSPTNPTSHRAHDSTSHTQIAPALQSLLASQDILSWSKQQAADWVVSIPQLAHMRETFLANSIDGKALLRLSDRKMLQNLKLASPIDRRLLLQHIADLKAIQVTYSTGAYQDIVDKIVKQLGTELELLKTGEKQKKTPNAFISLRINSPAIQAKVKEIQTKIQSSIAALNGSKCILPPEQLHFTICRLHLESPEDQAKAKQVLEKCDIVFNQIYKGQPMAVTFKGIANYGGNALFLETESGPEKDNLIEFGNTVFELFREASLASRNFRFQPVAPFVRVHATKKEAIPALQQLSTTLVPEFSSEILGKHSFGSVEISSVASETESDGYYKPLAVCTLLPSL